MKRFPASAAVMVAMLAGVALTPARALAGHKCDSPNSAVEQRACAKAAEGADSLRRFVERTRTIYGLSWFDFARADAPAVATTAPARIAEQTSIKVAGATSAP